jgi:hypothetical protein
MIQEMSRARNEPYDPSRMTSSAPKAGFYLSLTIPRPPLYQKESNPVHYYQKSRHGAKQLV